MGRNIQQKSHAAAILHEKSSMRTVFLGVILVSSRVKRYLCQWFYHFAMEI